MGSRAILVRNSDNWRKLQLSGDTRTAKTIIKKYGLWWAGRKKYWYVSPRTREFSVQDLIQELRAAGHEVETPGAAVIPFPSKRRKEAIKKQPKKKQQKAGDIVLGLGTGAPVSVADILSSPGIRFGTNAPYRLTGVQPSRIGFADTWIIQVNLAAKARDNSVVPLAKSLIHRWAREHGVEVSSGRGLTVSMGRKRLLTDNNPSSPSKGKGKMLQDNTYFMEVVRGSVPAVQGKTVEGDKYKRVVWPESYIPWKTQSYGPNPFAPWKRQKMIEWGMAARDPGEKDPHTFGLPPGKRRVELVIDREGKQLVPPDHIFLAMAQGPKGKTTVLKLSAEAISRGQQGTTPGDIVFRTHHRAEAESHAQFRNRKK
jgi:hypothetical protein